MSRLVRFNISDPDLPGIGKFGVEGVNDEGVAADFYLSVLIGATTVVPETKVGDNIADTAPYTDYNISVPVDASTGKYMTGSYTVNIIAKTAGTSTVLNTYTVAFSFNPYSRVSELSLTNSIDCNEGFFVLTDVTAYDSTAAITKSWVVTEPTVAGVPGSQITGSDDFVKIYFSYVNVVYQYLFESSIVYTIASGGDIDIYETHELSVDSSYKIDCDVNLAEIKQCVYDTLASLEAESCRVGGIDKLSGSKKEKWFKLNQYLDGWQFAKLINDADARKAYFLKIKDLLDCGCVEDDTVRAFILPDGSQQVQTSWQTVTTTFLNGFVNNTNPLKWRIDRDNRLHIVGKIQVPAALAANSNVLITTGFIPTAKLANISYENRHQMVDPAGDPQGLIYINSSSDLYMRVNGTDSTITFVYINMLIPLDI